MNEKLQYRAMLEMPENTASVIVKTPKKKKSKQKETPIDDVKEKVIEKVNETVKEPNKDVETSAPIDVSSEKTEDTVVVDDEVVEPIKDEANETNETIEKTAIVTKVPSIYPKKKEKKAFKKPSLIKVQVAIIGALIGLILLTSVINKNSGINVFMRNVFAPNDLEEVDERLYTDFAPVFSLSGGEIIKDENGLLTTSAEGSVYSPVEGVVSSVTKGEDGYIDVIIKHSENFSSKISGLKFFYLESGQKVSTTIPLGYSNDAGASMCFIGSDGEVIKDYSVTENSVVWTV